MYLFNFFFNSIFLSSIFLISSGFRYHCIGKNNRPPCFIDVIPQESAFRNIICKVIHSRKCQLIKNYMNLAENKLIKLENINRVLKDIIKKREVEMICALLKVYYKYPTYVKLHLSQHYFGAPGTRIMFSNGKYSLK
ncbi:Hypothetical protein SRAE_X000052000 [Strongyloides ratti]|uniref:Uncharacterized protein n=1 Tax=Strongyloides ratti TaxID=34506 RepID=A0A090N0S4_STRRB|nr:Hypothetical protein SRAE_X000052000 [Strongyloides ratti]CEF71193.2 Hypothetical protein SRAE_X000052000 [Strongyloides ratti]